jgi:PAS domain S-box-containing protein
MQAIIIQIVILLHAAFGCMFLILYLQHRREFSRLMALCWLLEALRAGIILSQFGQAHLWWNPWLGLWDCLGVIATWWLLSACADLTGKRLPPRLGRYYIGISLPLILGLRYLVPWGLSDRLGLSVDRFGFICVFITLIIIFVPVAIARGAILFWLINTWRRERLLGAAVATAFCVPYVVLAILSPFQFYFGFDPEWIYMLWAVRVLGFSLGLLILLFDKQLLAQRESQLELQESEKKFHAVFAQSPLAIVLTTLPEGRVADANQAAETMLGFKLAEVRGMTTTDMGVWVSLADRQRYLEMLRSAAYVSGYETQMRAKDGAELAVLLHGRVIQLGGQAFVLNSLIDITERKRVETDLQARTAFFEAQVESALDGIIVVDNSGKKILQNARVAEIWKIPPEVLNDPDDAQQVRFVTSRTKNPPEFVEKVARLYSHPAEISRDIIELVDGTILDRYSAPVIDRVGRHYGRIWTFRDITGNRKAEELARHLANFPELNPNPVLEFNADGQVAYSNPAAHAMVTRLGQDRLEQLLPADARNIVRQCLDTGEPRLRLVTTHGKTTLSWSFYPIGSHRVVHCYIGDITERTELELQLRQAQKMEAIGQLAGGVAHDFNNMLTAIIGHLGMLRGNPKLTREMDESLGEIAAAANRAAKLTGQLLAFSRRQVLTTKPLDLNEVVTHLAKMLRRLLGEHVTMQLDFSPEQTTFLGDAGSIEQVLVNLAVNARDAMPEGGTLRIKTQCVRRVPPATLEQSSPKPADYVWLSVSDTGTGIPPEIRAKIFEPFFTTKEVGKGTGLGLATVFGIVQQHHGWIEVESEPGQGARFHVFLPRLDMAPAAPAAPRSVDAPRGRNELVLLVEDEPSVKEVAAQALRRQGYRVVTAASGRAALEVWAQQRAEVDLLLTDMIMPEGISGHQLARQLLAEKPGLKVVYTSGYNAEIAGKELPLTEGLNYLAKPYELDHLFQTVRAALDGRLRPPCAED